MPGGCLFSKNTCEFYKKNTITGTRNMNFLYPSIRTSLLCSQGVGKSSLNKEALTRILIPYLIPATKDII